ncbi:vacuolar iron transporter (VIT) family protein [Actinidia rufa]|uniref:Vacuolar iron transporter (VIT) family protein n=1 Tax=Actinidia rufa TaxID=165716 RepID=A0A7J0EUC1_9ERIC|nr:vacuolar iron transporter (VIT) family protein [Actinidia rufa]
MMSVFLSLSLKLSKIAKNMKKSSITLKGRNGSEQLCWEPMMGLVAGACSMAIGEFVSVGGGGGGEHGIAALVLFGGVGAVLGRTRVVKSGTRVVFGGWMAMAITFGLTKLFGSSGLQM